MPVRQASPRVQTKAHFTPKLFQFLTELKANNNRAWFESNKARYEEEVKEPMLRFIGDFGQRLRAISTNFRADARPAGGSMFRIHRDIRFSRDKSPYKTNVGAHFPHAGGGRDAPAPGFYLHLAPGSSFGGGGLWHPDGAGLQRVRERIVGRPQDWKRLRQSGITIEGESLKRVPTGYAADHPLAEDLKLKDFTSMARFSDRQVCAPDFIDRFADTCGSAAPLVEFLTKALGLAW